MNKIDIKVVRKCHVCNEMKTPCFKDARFKAFDNYNKIKFICPDCYIARKKIEMGPIFFENTDLFQYTDITTRGKNCMGGNR